MTMVVDGVLEAVLTGLLTMAGVSYTSHSTSQVVVAEAPHTQERAEAMRISVGRGADRTEIVFVAQRGRVAPAPRAAARRLIWKLNTSQLPLPK